MHGTAMKNLEAFAMLLSSVICSSVFAYRDQNGCEVQDILSCYSGLRKKITDEVGFLPLPQHDDAQISYTRFCKRIFLEKSLCYGGSLTSCRMHPEMTARESMYHFFWHTVCGKELQSWRQFQEIMGNTEDGRCDRALTLLNETANHDDCRNFEGALKDCSDSVAEKIHFPPDLLPEAMRLVGCRDGPSQVASDISDHAAKGGVGTSDNDTTHNPTPSSSEPERELTIHVCEATRAAQCLSRPYKAVTDGGRSLFTTNTGNSILLNDVVTKFCRDGDWSKYCLKSLDVKFCTAAEKNGLDRLAGAADEAASVFCNNEGTILSDLIKSAHCWDTPGFAQCAESADIMNIKKNFFAPDWSPANCRNLENSATACIQRSVISGKNCSSPYASGAKKIISAYLSKLNCDSSTNAFSATTPTSIFVMFLILLVVSFNKICCL
ncbi:uncharacterized protein LOC119439920 [Dermacentor silvarum]|uniref:uncharacterized protein LOC119439920 n=1 Tax=Dermacentor silvarum TaxID=543639 RepID=UPI002100C897|nr:uncharacterized protein LOC119439920 [Dermacentor silvarum]